MQPFNPQLQTKHTNSLLVCKSKPTRDYILKPEVKIKRLKNLKEKYYVQVFTRASIIHVWLAERGQAEADRVHIIQHCMTFRLVNPKWFLKRQNTFQEAVFKARTKKKRAESEKSAAVSSSVCSQSGLKHLGLFHPNLAPWFLFFFFNKFCMIQREM